MIRLNVLGQDVPDSERAELTDAEGAQIARELESAIEGEVRFGRHDRLLYATDASSYQVEPIGVVCPGSIEDAERAIRFCLERRLPILPRGGGTSLAGQCTNRAVVIDFSPSCTRLIEFDEASRRGRVEPGITIDDLNDRIADSGLFFAPDPSTSRHANVGGCIGNNAAGSRSIRYGRTSENLRGIDAMLASGKRVRFESGAEARDPLVAEITERVVSVVERHAPLIRERFPKTIRRNAGYGLDAILAQLETGRRADLNLAPLLCGSEGTLAVTLGAELELRPIPRARGLAVIAFASLEEAIERVKPLVDTGPSAVELLDDMVIGVARGNVEYRRYVELLPTAAGGRTEAVLYVEYESDTGRDELDDRFAELRRTYGQQAVSTHTDPDEMARAWKLRKAGEPLLHGIPGDRKPVSFVEDNAVPVERLGEFVEGFKRIVASHGTRAAYWAHASVGVLHVRPLLDITDDADRRRMHEMAMEVADLAKSLGGVMSGEHGDGRVRGPLLERYFGPELMDAFREIKAIFDPDNLLNPDDIIAPGPIESITERLRVKPDDSFAPVPPVETYFGYEDQHGFAGAVNMCNGAGVCRKKTGGTMCPSYMGSLDERHSTRGRGNALRLAITGQFGRDHDGRPSWDDPETMETLNLCLSCKACKAECPSNVDIARLKSEYTAQRFRQRGGPTLQARVFGRVRALNRLGSMTPGIANWVNRQLPTKRVLERVLKLDRRRSVPAFARPLTRDFTPTRRRPPEPGGSRPAVALFGDCFTVYNEPGIGRAAQRVLEAFGYEVHLAMVGCCGRPMISTGVLEGAIASIDATLERLRPWIESERLGAMLFLEPSCLSAVTDDWMELKLRTPRALRERLVDRSLLCEDFIDRFWDEHPARPEFDAPPGRVLLHGHCHQKALWGAETSGRLLRRLCGDSLEVLDAGCCGMAGSFGYTTDRYDLSMAIGELTLFPAAREALGEDLESVVVAPGASCRHQVHDGVGRTPLHPLELAARLV